ncbi:hypothetical protein KQ41_18050 [Lysinibacillus fusiformis]|nr:hypothetical protein HR49_10400 [Lysinibacillus fusiformis]KGA80735.1 hypothetical protein KQ41_18050 [Lysinibacillus fusiformis]KHK53046.1 hypothetical protein PI85_07710 [Lysinibacillus sp. A1]
MLFGKIKFLETKKWKTKILTFILVCKMIQGLKVKLQQITWNKRSDSNVEMKRHWSSPFAQHKHVTWKKNGPSIHSLDHIVKANFQLNKKVEMLVPTFLPTIDSF